MTMVPISSTFDISSARNLLRQRIAKKNWLPPFRARATTSLTLMAELILLSQKPGTLDVSILAREGEQGVELKCDLVDDGHILRTHEYHDLEGLVDSVKAYDRDGHIHLVAQLWLS